MSKYVRETAAGKSISAYVITKGARDVATVQVHFSNGGRCLVNIWQTDEAAKRCARYFVPGKYHIQGYSSFSFQYATAGGYGYDKLTSALSTLYVDGHELTDHCSRKRAPKPPKGRKLFPRDFKAPRGYSLANYTEISKATGKRIYRDEWINRAYEALGIADAEGDVKNARWDDVAAKMYDLETAWRATDDYESGYADCYRLEGFKYLEAIGYRVRNVI